MCIYLIKKTNSLKKVIMGNEMLGELVWKKYEWKLVYFII